MKKLLTPLAMLTLLLGCLFALHIPALAATEGDYEYTVTDGAATITKYTGAGGDVTIPATLGGYPVTKIGDQSFISQSELTSVVIPEGVTGIYWRSFAFCPKLTSVTLPQSLTILGDTVFQGCTALSAINLPDNLTTINGYAFQDCSSLTSITIPEGVTEIRDGVFWCCYSLQEVTLPASVTDIGFRAFRECNITDVYYGGTNFQWQAITGDGKSSLNSANVHILGVSNDPEIVNHLTFEFYNGEITITGYADTLSGDVVLPATVEGYPVTAIRYAAFFDCARITSVTVPDSVTSIGWDAFGACVNLKSATLGNGITQLDSGTFYNCYRLETVVLPETITQIPGSTFSCCESLRQITLPATVTAIGGYAFQGCINLQTINLPEGLTSIGSAAFRNCSALTAVTLPDNLTTVGEFAFRRCSNLESVSIGRSLSELGMGAFTDCNSLKVITVSPDNLSFASDAQGALLSKDNTQLLLVPKNKITSFVIPQTVTEIGYAAFADGRQLKQIDIPETVTAIGSYAFAGTGLTAIDLPAGLCAIDEHAFADTALTQVTIPGSVTYLGSYVFWDCDDLERVTLGEGVAEIGFCTFENCRKLTAVALPTSLQTVYSYAFSDCSSLFYVYYAGSENQWNAVLINSGNQALTDALLRVNATMPETPEVPSLEDLLTYTIQDGAVTITGGHSFLKGAVEIPATIEGYPVTAIGDTAFEGCYALTSVTLPDSVVSIGRRAFFSCYNMTELRLGAGVAQIGVEAINENAALKAIYVSESNPNFAGEPQGALLSKDGTVLIAAPGAAEEYTMPDSVVTVGESAFYGCRQLRKLTFGKNTAILGDYAFANCSALEKVNLPASLTTIGDEAFSHCENNTGYTVAAGNPNFSSDSRGVLFNKDKTVLILAPMTLQGSYTAPGSVTRVANSAFTYCYNLEKLVFGNQLTTLEDRAFYCCYNLNSVTLPVSLERIGWRTFYDVYLQTVYYTGTQEQWTQVQIDSDNDSLRYCQYVYEHIAYTPGDVDGIEGVSIDDAIYLLQSILMPDQFPVEQPTDFNADGMTNIDDAIYLLQHVLMPDQFPLN